MKSYYKMHESLNDSDFQEFIDQKLPFGFCEALPDKPNILPRLSVLQRNLNGEGSHRHLSSSIRLNIKLDSISELHPHKCQVILIERLPSGVYADPFELQHLLQRGGIVLSCFLMQKQGTIPILLCTSNIWCCFPISLSVLINLMQYLMILLYLEIQIWNHLHFSPIVQLLRLTWMLVPLPCQAKRI